MSRETERITKRAVKTGVVGSTRFDTSSMASSLAGSSFGWESPAGGQSRLTVGGVIDPIEYDLPEGLPVRHTE